MSNLLYSTKISIKARNKKNSMKAWGNKMIKSPDLKKYEQDLIDHFKATTTSQPYAGPIKLTAIFTFGDRRRRDVQNLFDILCDTMNNIIYDDDSQIQILHGEKEYMKNIWGIEIIVEKV